LRKTRFHLLLLSILLLAFSSCKVTRQLHENEYLLVKNEIDLNKDQADVSKLNFDKDDLSGLIQQKPNKRLLGLFRFREWINMISERGKETKFKKWVNRSFGRDPVIFDEYAVERSAEQLKLYLNNHGFFYSDIEPEIEKRKKKAKVTYKVNLSQPYFINDIEYVVQDTVIHRIVLDDAAGSLIERGQIYNASMLDDERYRITSLLRNHGYFYFSPEFVFYEIDSAFGNHTLKVYKNIQQFQVRSDTGTMLFEERSHRKYHINKIAVNTEFSPLRSDTSRMTFYAGDSESPDNTNNRILLYYRDKLRIRPQAIRYPITLEPLKLYSERKENTTFRNLSSLSLYAYTSLQFRVMGDPSKVPDTNRYYLNALINLTRRPVQSFSIETEGTTSGGKLGLAGNLVYQNLNIFKGAEVLTLKLTGGVEWQQGGARRDDVFLFFNTIQSGAEGSLDFPKFLLPISQEKLPRVIRPRTTIKLGINYQNRPDYKRYVSNASYGYNWRIGRFVSHSLIPLEVNSVSISPDSSFVQRLNDLNDPRLTNQYTDHFIMSAKYSFIYNNQERGKVKNFTFFRWVIESAGNLLQLANQIAGTEKNEEGKYVLWSIPYSQFFRTNLDFRYYLALDENNTLVYRNMAGIGIPYSNSSVLPFEKGFYAGGANDMRGWKYRSLGPGSFRDTVDTYFEKMGDLALEANIEYRFPIYGFFKGALFTDIGNIWLLNASENYPGGKFDVEEFLSEFGFNAGFGLRLDFNFFIFRVDAAIPLKDPSFPKGERWRHNYLRAKDIIWNFGIGYPF
jgi:outer membrane protein assembly factor BamA